MKTQSTLLERKRLDTKARRMANRLGYCLVKSRTMNPSPDDYGRYQIFDADTMFPVAGWRYSFEVQDAIDWLSDSA